MKFLRTSVDVTNIGFANNGTITCEITVYYKSVGGDKKRAVHVFNVSRLIEEWEKWNTFVRVVEKSLNNVNVVMSQDGSNNENPLSSMCRV